MIPLMMSFVAGRRDEHTSVLRAFGFSCVFVLGLSLTFTALGMAAALAGTLYGDVSGAWNWLVAGVAVVMGLHLLGVVTVPFPSLGDRVQPKTRGFLGAFVLGLLFGVERGFLGAFVLGLLFGVVSAPCAAPMLVVLLAYLAGSGSSVAWGGTLLLVYALGHSVLILVAGTSMGAARKLIENKRATRALELLRKGAGAAIVLVGLWFAYRGMA
jgi:cytochrome c biogenesis protein CcdA